MFKIGDKVASIITGNTGEVVFRGSGEYMGHEVDLEPDQVLVEYEGYEKPFLFKECNLIAVEQG